MDRTVGGGLYRAGCPSRPQVENVGSVRGCLFKTFSALKHCGVQVMIISASPSTLTQSFPFIYFWRHHWDLKEFSIYVSFLWTLNKILLLLLS